MRTRRNRSSRSLPPAFCPPDAQQPGGHAGRRIASSFGEGFFGTSYFRDPIPETSICSRRALGLERTAAAERWVHEGRMTGGNRREKLGRSACRAAQSRIYRGEVGEKGGASGRRGLNQEIRTTEIARIIRPGRIQTSDTGQTGMIAVCLTHHQRREQGHRAVPIGWSRIYACVKIAT